MSAEWYLSDRSFPQLREFLEVEILGTDYPVKHLIEQARNKGRISKGKTGRGGAKVTTRDAVILMLGALSGDTPATASDAMKFIDALSPPEYQAIGASPPLPELETDWWNRSFVDAVCIIVDQFRGVRSPIMDDLEVTIKREPVFGAFISWNHVPYERDDRVTYVLSEGLADSTRSGGKRKAEVSLNGQYWQILADWLEDRSPYCEPGSYRFSEQE